MGMGRVWIFKSRWVWERLQKMGMGTGTALPPMPIPIDAKINFLN